MFKEGGYSYENKLIVIFMAILRPVCFIFKIKVNTYSDHKPISDTGFC
ncbi:hypothetical protein Y59_14010 [Enterobacter hormaechei]|nr:hypothetical protein Y59_14010 [Enterobacter hormaechei]